MSSCCKSHPEWATASATRKTNSATLALAHGHAHVSANVSTAASAAVPAARGSCSEKHTSKLSTGPSKKIGISNLAGYFEGSADSGATVIGANAAGGQLGPGSASEEVCPKLAGTKTIASKVVGTCICRLVIKTSVSLARSLGSSVLAYRKVCQKGAGRAGVQARRRL